jgi:membrane protease YdiL (CAAX protease family)
LPSVTAPLGPPLRGGDVLRVILLGLALLGVTFLIIQEIAADTPKEANRIAYVIAWLAASCLAWFAAIWFVFVRGRGMSLADLGYTVPERRWAMRGLAFGFLSPPLAVTVGLLLRPVFQIETSTSLQQFFNADFNVVHAVTLLLYGGFLVPIAEELVFRGLLFRWLRQRFEFWPAAFISSAAFGLAHLRADQVIVAGLLGLPLAWLYEKSRSLAPAILMHQTYNSLLLMLTYVAVWFSQPNT